MNGMLILDRAFVRALQDEWIETVPVEVHGREQPRRGEGQGKRQRYQYRTAIRRLAQRVQATAQRVPDRYSVMDWAGRRLITWGWRLRTKYGTRSR